MKKLMLGLLMAFAATAEAEVTIDGVKYTLDTAAKTATITGYDLLNQPTTVVASEVEYEGQKYTVTSVGDNGLSGCSSLTSVSLPNATTIGGNAFRECGSLTSVSLPNATTIGGSAFDSCSSLTSVSLPNATTIEGYAFYVCSSLISVSLPNATTIGEKAFYDCGSLAIVFLPNATTIGKWAFQKCSSLTSVSLPNATTIVEWAFDSCSSLTSVSLPNATTIERYVFYDCGSLAIVFLPNATTIGEWAFDFCTSLTEVSFPNATTIGGDAFYSCFSLTSVSLPNATTIGGNAFLNCHTLETVAVSWGLLANPDRAGWRLRDAAKLVGPFTNDEIKNATHKVAMFAGEKLIDKENYEKGCAAYGITPKPEPQVFPPAPEPPAGAVMTWDALTNMIATAESGAEIAVGADITEEGGELVVPAGKAVAIKLYGKTVSCGLVTVGGALTVGDAEDTVGKIVASDGAKIAKSGSVTLLNGPVRGTFTTKSPGLVMMFR